MILHNPRCSKSRQTLALLEEKGAEIEIIEYLNSPPTQETLQFICSKLQVKPIEIIRTKEKCFKELNLSAQDERSDEEWFNIMIQNPILIERPIVIYNQKVVIGRPPENVLKII